MEFLEVCDEVSGCGRDEVLVKVRGDAGMVSFVSEKRRDSCGGIRGIIISKFGNGE